MVDVTPAGITPGDANDESVVHASDADLGNLSRSHTERGISRLQSAILPYSASKTYKVGDMVIDQELLWINIIEITVPEAFDINKWNFLSNALGILIQSYDTDAAADGQFFSVNGSPAGKNAEVDAQAPTPFGPLRFLFFAISVETNTLVNPFTWTFRVNGADGNGQVTVGAGLTGEFQDTTNIDDVTALDLVDYVFREGGGAGAATLIGSSCLTLRGPP